MVAGAPGSASGPAAGSATAATGRRWQTALPWLPPLLAIILYWPSLRLPLIYDTLLHIRIAKGLDFLSVWLPSDAFGFFRPFTFLPFLIIEPLFGYYPAWLLHGLNVAQHALNGLLLATLVNRLWGRPLRGLLAGLMLVTFPFAYQAVAVYGHNVHPHLVNIYLLALHAYLNGVTGRRRAWWGVTLLLFVVAVLSHESAILLGLFAGLVHLQVTGTGTLGGDVRQQLRWLARPSLIFLRRNAPWLTMLALSFAYFFAYQFLPISRAPQAAELSGGAIIPRLLYLAQALAHPVVRVVTWWRALPASLLVGSGFLVSAGLSIWRAADPAARWPLLMGWVWWGLASLLLTLSLSTDYLLHGPRLLYLGGVGVAIVWATLLEGVLAWRPARRPWLGPALGSAAALLALLPAILFVSARLRAYAALTAPVRVVASVMADRPVDEGIMLVNLPQWLAPSHRAYPVGVEFVVMLGDYLFAEELVEENVPGPDGVVRGRPVRAGTLLDLRRDPDYGYSVHNQAPLSDSVDSWAPAGAHVFTTYYEPSGPRPVYVGRLQPATTPTPALADLGPYRLAAATAAWCRGVVSVALTWRLGAPVPPTTSLFVQLLNADGTLAAQADGPPLDLRPDLLTLPAGWEMVEWRTLAAPDANGRLLLGAYDFASGERFAATAADGTPQADNAFVLPITVTNCP